MSKTRVAIGFEASALVLRKSSRLGNQIVIRATDDFDPANFPIGSTASCGRGLPRT
jgi:hypothetical protein